MKKGIIITVLATFILNGCSSLMALEGGKEPDFSVITVGQEKETVELQPLKPIEVETLENGNFIATYEYVAGKEPSVGRAVVYGLLDVATLSISELITMPIEASKKGTTKIIKIEYTKDGQVVRVR